MAGAVAEVLRESPAVAPADLVAAVEAPADETVAEPLVPPVQARKVTAEKAMEAAAMAVEGMAEAATVDRVVPEEGCTVAAATAEACKVLEATVSAEGAMVAMVVGAREAA